jgi:hypothetical protein
MVLEAIEVFKGRAGKFFRASFAAIGMKIPEDGHSPKGELSGVSRAMEILHGVKEAVLVVHESVHHVAGAMGLWVLEGEFEIGGIGLEFSELIEQDLGEVVTSVGPLSEPS